MKSFHAGLTALLMSVLIVFSGAVGAQATVNGAVAPSSVIDNGEMFSPAEEDALKDTIVQHYEKYGLFFTVETVPSLDGQVLETVSLARANDLGIGEAGKNNGVFIFLSRDDRKIRFELGSGVSSAVTDVDMTNIIASQVTPSFQAGNYASGVELGMTAVGEDYTGVPAGDNNGWVTWTLLIGVGIPVFFFLIAGMYQFFGKAPRRERKDEQARLDSYSRLKQFSAFISGFRFSADAEKYKTLPNEQSRLKFLQTEHPEIAASLQKHYSSELPTTLILDRDFYPDTNDFFLENFSKSDSPVKRYKLWGTGFENMSIDEAINLIQQEKQKYFKGLEEQRGKEKQVTKIWESIPESTRKALKNTKNRSDRLALGNSAEFSANYALIASMFLSDRSSSSGDSGSGSSSRSNSSSSSSSSYDSGSYGGGSFDGGGGSGSW